MKRQNFFVDDERLEALKHVASAERISVAELVREGIDRVIRDRMHNPRTERAALRADLEAYLQKYAGRSKHRTDDDIDRIVTQARESASKQ